MQNLLVQNIDSPSSKYLVFTSAGENSNLDCWLKGFKNFDLWINYYGDQKNTEENFKEKSDFFTIKKGGKFPNFYYIYQNWREILDYYEAIFMMDDDLIITGSKISRLFTIRDKYDLWILQPAFNPRGKISHGVTMPSPYNFLTYTNFVEVTCPLFKKEKLDEFMKVYDPILVGTGIDLWYSSFLESDSRDKIAVIDQITCINPLDDAKGGQREIRLLQADSERLSCWEQAIEKYNIQVPKLQRFSSVPRSRISQLMMYVFFGLRNRFMKSE